MCDDCIISAASCPVHWSTSRACHVKSQTPLISPQMTGPCNRVTCLYVGAGSSARSQAAPFERALWGVCRVSGTLLSDSLAPFARPFWLQRRQRCQRCFALPPQPSRHLRRPGSSAEMGRGKDRDFERSEKVMLETDATTSWTVYISFAR